MGFLDKIGVGDLGFSFGKSMSLIGQIGILLVLLIIVGFVFYLLLWRRKQKKTYKENIHWFERVPGNPLAPIEDNVACELTIPGSNIKVFYIKSKDLYLPRPTRNMGKNHYWYAIRDNKEISNFSLKDINEETGEAGLDYDQTSMKYADSYLRELIQRNYRDKAIPWWKEYKDVIATAILIFMLGVVFFFLFSRLEKVVGAIGKLVEHVDTLIKSAEAYKGSGVIEAT